MKDWKGNKIKVGQTVIKVRYKTMFAGNKQRFVLICYDEKGNKASQTFGEESIVPLDYFWDIKGRYIITEKRNSMTISFGESPSEVPVDNMDFILCTQPWEILCIEGLSDNKDEFFQTLPSA